MTDLYPGGCAGFHHLLTELQYFLLYFSSSPLGLTLKNSENQDSTPAEPPGGAPSRNLDQSLEIEKTCMMMQYYLVHEIITQKHSQTSSFGNLEVRKKLVWGYAAVMQHRH